jgi:hypothetical protein
MPHVVVVAVVCLFACVGGCAPSSSPAAARRCNGHEALCERPLDEVVFAGAHNAMSSRDDGFLAPNQFIALPGQLRLGVRAFMLDTYAPDPAAPDDGVRLCHGSCDLGVITLEQTLARLARFLDEEPDTVVHLMLQDDASIVDTAAAFEAEGLFGELAVLDGRALPTLGDLIDDGTRIVVTAENQGPDPGAPWFMPMFSLFQDTPFTFASVDDLAAEASCAANRGDADSPLLLVNHWLGNPLPDDTLADDANAAAILDERVRRCAVRRGRPPHVVAVAFVDVGDLITVVDGLNGL